MPIGKSTIFQTDNLKSPFQLPWFLINTQILKKLIIIIWACQYEGKFHVALTSGEICSYKVSQKWKICQANCKMWGRSKLKGAYKHWKIFSRTQVQEIRACVQEPFVKILHATFGSKITINWISWLSSYSFYKAVFIPFKNQIWNYLVVILLFVPAETFLLSVLKSYWKDK